MNPVEIIAKKRDGKTLTRDEINAFVQGFVRGDIPDYQAAAWLMAVVLRGMSYEETADFTLAIVNSGSRLDLSGIASFVADKHSTGGVGDKTTLVVAPVVAAAGLPVAKMSGRALGFTGGTLDKLESIRGFRADLTTEEFLAQVRQHGIVVAGQSKDLAPADGKLYALRDVTATVDSMPLIAASIMSKKIASGANGIVLDVKVGRGAFMETEERALELAQTMVRIGRSLGRRVTAVLSDMNQPLGLAVGNAVEVKEAIDALNGRGPKDFVEHSLAVGAQMLLLAGRVKMADEGTALLRAQIVSGAGFAKLKEMVAAQGGDTSYLSDPSRLPQARFIQPLPSPQTGFVASIDAREVGLTAALLGAGRKKKGDPVDYAVGVVLIHKVGSRIHAGQPLLTIHANSEEHLAEAQQRLLSAIRFSDARPEPPPLIHRILRDTDVA
jgi:pyrimidine-nucleoside phosphorylase